MSRTTETSTSEAEAPPPVLLIDGRSIFDRGWHAAQRSEELAHLDSARAATCSAFMVLLPILGSTHLDENYRHALFCWDAGFHKTVKPRPPKPESFAADFDHFKRMVRLFVGGAHVALTTHEADDVVATAAFRATSQGRRACVVSGDKDLQQLVSRQVAYYDLNRKTLLSAQSIMDRWDLRHPSHLAVRLAVVGDHHDGIGGVEKWGEKKWTPKIMATAPVPCDLAMLVEHVATVIPPAQIDNFYTSLNATLLQTDVPGVPEPEPLVAMPLDLIEEEGLSPIQRNYAHYLGDLRGTESVASDVDREY